MASKVILTIPMSFCYSITINSDYCRTAFPQRSYLRLLNTSWHGHGWYQKDPSDKRNLDSFCFLTASWKENVGQLLAVLRTTYMDALLQSWK